MSEQTTPAPTEEEVAKTLAEYERLAQETGEWNGREATEFSNDGQTFSPVWLKSDAHPHPLVARATVHRKGVEHPATAYVIWDEAVPADDAWRSLWEARPTTLFGAFTARTSIRSAFRAAIGTRREPDDLPVTPPTAPGAPERDWDAELADAPDVATIDQVWSDARAARARTGAREKTWKEIRAALIAAEWNTPAAEPAPQEQLTETPALAAVPRPPADTVPRLEPRARKQQHERRQGGRR